MIQQERIKEINEELRILRISVAPTIRQIEELEREKGKLKWEIKVNENLRGSASSPINTINTEEEE